MPVYLMKEKRMLTVEYEIEAESREDAEKLYGNILSEHETDNSGYELISCEELLPSLRN